MRAIQGPRLHFQKVTMKEGQRRVEHDLRVYQTPGCQKHVTEAKDLGFFLLLKKTN